MKDKRKRRKIVVLAAVLALILLTGIGWLLYRRRKKNGGAAVQETAFPDIAEKDDERKEDSRPSPEKSRKHGKGQKKAGSGKTAMTGNGKKRKILAAVLALIFLVSAGRVAYQVWQYKSGEAARQKAAEIAAVPSVEDADDDAADDAMEEVTEDPEEVRAFREAADAYIDAYDNNPYDGGKWYPLKGEAEQRYQVLEEKGLADYDGVQALWQYIQDNPAEYDPYAEEMIDIDIAALQETNPDVMGWISIPDTELSYPLLAGEDNKYYLSHDWMGEENICGSIFLDSRCSSDLNGFHTVIFGHKMKNGSMFGMLYQYADAAFWEEHPSIYVLGGGAVRRYDIYAAWQAKAESSVYAIGFPTMEDLQNFLEMGLEESAVSNGIIPTASDKILTLSTCTGSGHSSRQIVRAVLRLKVDLS